MHINSFVYSRPFAQCVAFPKLYQPSCNLDLIILVTKITLTPDNFLFLPKIRGQEGTGWCIKVEFNIFMYPAMAMGAS